MHIIFLFAHTLNAMGIPCTQLLPTKKEAPTDWLMNGKVQKKNENVSVRCTCCFLFCCFYHNYVRIFTKNLHKFIPQAYLAYDQFISSYHKIIGYTTRFTCVTCAGSFLNLTAHIYISANNYHIIIALCSPRLCNFRPE